MSGEDFYKRPGETTLVVPTMATELGLSADAGLQTVDLALKDRRGRIIRAIFSGPELHMLLKCCMDALHIKQANMVREVEPGEDAS